MKVPVRVGMWGVREGPGVCLCVCVWMCEGEWEEERLWKRCFRSRYEAAGRECVVVPEMECRG